MTQVYLFDWGNTLMVDFPEVSGKMCNWQVVEAVSGAKEALENLSKTSKIYIATGAADSTEVEIQMAFERVGLNQYISGYFCKENVGICRHWKWLKHRTESSTKTKKSQSSPVFSNTNKSRDLKRYTQIDSYT